MSNSGKNVQLVAEFLASANGTSPVSTFQLGPDALAVLQVSLSAAGSVQLQVRLSPDAPFENLGSAVTTSSVVSLTRAFPQYQAVVTGNTGSARAWVMS